MKITSLRKLWAILLAFALIATACEPEGPETPDVPDTPQEKPDVPADKEPTISLEVMSSTTNSITIRLTSTDATAVKWFCTPQGINTASEQLIMAQGTDAEPSTECEITIDDLYAGCAYEITALAQNGDQKAVLSRTFVVQTTSPEISATYVLCDNLKVVDFVASDSYRNDYIHFYGIRTDYSLFIDFYSAIGGNYLPSGHYPLAPLAEGVSNAEYTYFMETSDADFIRFTEGYADVTAIEGEQGVFHIIDARYTLPSGETVALYFAGII